MINLRYVERYIVELFHRISPDIAYRLHLICIYVLLFTYYVCLHIRCYINYNSFPTYGMITLPLIRSNYFFPLKLLFLIGLVTSDAWNMRRHLIWHRLTTRSHTRLHRHSSQPKIYPRRRLFWIRTCRRDRKDQRKVAISVCNNKLAPQPSNFQRPSSCRGTAPFIAHFGLVQFRQERCITCAQIRIPFPRVLWYLRHRS